MKYFKLKSSKALYRYVFFFKSRTQIIMRRTHNYVFFLDVLFLQIIKNYIEFDTTQKAQKNKKTGFPKESLENADLYKPVMSKMMTIHE